MKKRQRDISRFSAKAACRYRLVCFAIVFILVTILAVGSALILAFDESAPPPTYTIEFTQDGSTPNFFSPLSRLDGTTSGVTAYFLCSLNET